MHHELIKVMQHCSDLFFESFETSQNIIMALENAESVEDLEELSAYLHARKNETDSVPLENVIDMALREIDEHWLPMYIEKEGK